MLPACQGNETCPRLHIRTFNARTSSGLLAASTGLEGPRGALLFLVDESARKGLESCHFNLVIFEEYTKATLLRLLILKRYLTLNIKSQPSKKMS